MTFFNGISPFDIIVEDSQSAVISDFYAEQTHRILKLAGKETDAPGRFTFLAHKFHAEYVRDIIHVNDYKGDIFIGARFYAQTPAQDGEQGVVGSMRGVPLVDRPIAILHAGDNPVNLMLVGCTYQGGKPDIATGRGATLILANDHAEGQRWHEAHTITEDAKRNIANALDHLRLLGHHDLAFKVLEAAHLYR
jgi:hypothetical protein